MDPIYKSQINRDVPPAKPGEFEPVQLGPLRVWPPVVLAPMAGVTNAPFRTLCRKYGAGLYVSEMITARAFVEGNEKTQHLSSFAEDETIRSLQLYGVDPFYVGEAVKKLVGEEHVHHIDMNFGCPVKKVTRKGGGAALPAKPNLLRNIVRAAVQNAGAVPITIKFRVGIEEGWETFADAGRIAEEEGCAAVTMHARTAAQHYDGQAQWDHIGELKQLVSIPVFGNGDIWEAEDALRMMRYTGCDGVGIGRGCLGRPWLFRDLTCLFEGREPQNPPNFGQVADIMREHAHLLTQWIDENRGMKLFRKHAGWYTKGFHGSTKLRTKLMTLTSLAALEETLSSIDRSSPFPANCIRVPRGKRGGTQRVVLPDGYRDQREDTTPPPPEAEANISGG